MEDITAPRQSTAAEIANPLFGEGLYKRPEPSFRIRRFLARFIPGALVLIALILGGLHYSRQLDYQVLLTEETARMALSRGVIENFIQTVVSDLHFLANSEYVGRYFSTGEDLLHWTLINKEFANFARHKPAYHSILLIDAHGQERVRVDRQGDQLRIAAHQEMRNLSAQGYFFPALALQQGQAYFSPQPLRRADTEDPPLIRVVTPLFSGRHDLQGLLVLCVDARILLDMVKRQAANWSGDTLLLDPAGKIVFQRSLNGAGPNASTSAGHSIASPLWEAIQSLDQGGLRQDGAHYLVATIATTPNISCALDAPYLWKLVSRIPILPLLGSSPLETWLLLGGLAVLLAALAAGILSHLRVALEKGQHHAAERLAATVFGTVSEGVLISDPENRILAVNPGFCRITGFSPDEVLGKNPQLLSSGRHDATFYEQMWSAIHQHGHWEGEIWNRRHDGSVFPEWLSIVSIERAMPEQCCYVGVFSDITSRKQAEDVIRHHAHYDLLTDLPNRLLFVEQLRQSVTLALRNQQKLALLFIDLDRFKQINDTHGHAAGDELLAEVGNRLRTCIRDSDAAARLSGDEFTILLQNIQSDQDAEMVAEKVLASLSLPYELSAASVSLSASIGIALLPRDAESASDLLCNADQAMYYAKQTGRNQFRFFSAQMNDHMQDYLEMEKAIDDAIATDDFVTYLQPVYDATNHRLHGAEALLRWRSEPETVLEADNFLQTAVRSGQIVQLGRASLGRVCGDLRRHQDRLPPDFRLYCNLSQREIHQPDWLSWLRDLLAAHELPPRLICFDVPAALITGTSAPDTVLHGMRELGVRLALQDFGSQCFSLKDLKAGRLDEVKLSPGLVQSLNRDSSANEITRAVLRLAPELHLQVVACGVETREQADFLKAEGCHYLQGKLLAPSAPPEALFS